MIASNPTVNFLSHELRAEGPNIDKIHRELSSTIRVNAAPLTTEDWLAACQQADLTVEHHDIGPMTLLKPLVALPKKKAFPPCSGVGGGGDHRFGNMIHPTRSPSTHP